jgi:hypothetical protein
MNITVILFTYNRCQGLAKTLESVAACTLSDAVDWEVLEVDNNSTDAPGGIGRLLPSISRSFPLRIRAPARKISCGPQYRVREARGDVLTLMDTA